MGVLAELKNRGVGDVCIACCDGLKCLPEVIHEIWPQATVQQCVVHLVRASLRYAAKGHWSQITKHHRSHHRCRRNPLRRLRTGVGREVPGDHPAVALQLETFTPFLAFPPETRKVIYTTSAIESLNARFRQATRRTAGLAGCGGELHV
jgi:transposase-like protein